MAPNTCLRATGMLPCTLRRPFRVGFERASCGAEHALPPAGMMPKFGTAVSLLTKSVGATALKPGPSLQLRPCLLHKFNNVGGMGIRCQAAASPAQKDIGADVKESLMLAARKAAESGAKVVMAALDQPRVIVDKSGANDIVTDTDKRTEEAVLSSLRASFPHHLVLGEEGGVSGGGDASSSEFLWVVDPLDGTTNFAHSYPSFAVSVGVLFRGRPVAGAIVEFAGGPFCWGTRTFYAYEGGGAYCNGQRIHVTSNGSLDKALLVAGFGYKHEDPWALSLVFHKHFTDVTRGVRRLGAAAVDLCHVALGLVDAYWEFELKPWDTGAGVLFVREAGGIVTELDGSPFSVFSRSILASNGAIHEKMLEVTREPTLTLIREGGLDNSKWFIPEGYHVD